MMKNPDAEAHQAFNELPTVEKKLEWVWFGLRELAEGQEEIIKRQDTANGGIAKALKELTAHLETHRLEKQELDFIRKWGGRGTAAIIGLVALFGGGGGAIAIINWIWG